MDWCTGMCPHWSVVVGPIATTTQPLLTTTQASLHHHLSIKSAEILHLMQFCTTLAKKVTGKKDMSDHEVMVQWCLLYEAEMIEKTNQVT